MEDFLLAKSKGIGKIKKCEAKSKGMGQNQKVWGKIELYQRQRLLRYVKPHFDTIRSKQICEKRLK